MSDAVARLFRLTVVTMMVISSDVMAQGLGGISEYRIERAGRVLDIAISSDEMALSNSEVMAWVEQSADAVSLYFGRLPIAHARISIETVAGRGVKGGQTRADDVVTVRVRVGRQSQVGDLMRRDWVMVHEMIHLGIPRVGWRHNWFQEGAAVYVESVARVAAGDLTPEQIWGDFVRDMPKGLPAEGDEGLDHTDSWGRTYWGGALYFLLADIRIHQETGGRFGLRDALRGINSAGDYSRAQSLDAILASGDAATGTRVLTELYADMKDRPAAPDLDRLWKELGVALVDGAIRFNDDAPLASIRRVLTEAPRV
jgi:hypothetical protein